MSDETRETEQFEDYGEASIPFPEEELLNIGATDDLDREGKLPEGNYTVEDPLSGFEEGGAEGEREAAEEMREEDPEPKPFDWESEEEETSSGASEPRIEEPTPAADPSNSEEWRGESGRTEARSTPGRPTVSTAEHRSPGEDPKERPEPEVEFQRGCAVIGPSGAGKTYLLLAIETACTLLESGQPEMRFIPLGNTPELIKQAIKILKKEKKFEGTTEHAEYEFILQAGDSEPLHMRVEDGPGGALFPDELRRKRKDGTYEVVVDPNFEIWEKTMVQKVADSRHLILCVDASEPRSDLWRVYLPRLISELMRQQGVKAFPSAREKDAPESTVESETSSRWKQAWKRFTGAASRRLRPRKKPDHGLKYERVLILLTKMDKFAASVLKQLRQYKDWLEKEHGKDALKEEASYATLTYLTELSPRELLERLDPVEQAREILGPSLLQRIRSAMSPKTKIAVGLSSAGGFKKKEGDPFFGPDGGPTVTAGVGKEDVLRDWTPYGVQEAMLFMVTGEPNRRVGLLAREHLDRQRQEKAANIVSEMSVV